MHVSWAAQTGKHLLRTQNASEQNQKHFCVPDTKFVWGSTTFARRLRLRDMLTARAFLITCRWRERFAGVLETGGRVVSFQSFLSILRVFFPR